MCWYSAEHSGRALQSAEVGQRLGVRKMHSGFSWVVKESDIGSGTPGPVCLLDGTCAVFRLTEPEQAQLQLGPEPEAVFRMNGHKKRDVFEFQDGRQIEVNHLPAGLIFDVLMVPGKEHLSNVLDKKDEHVDAEPVLVTQRLV
jgi:hypothetical protein